jgi:FkbM family methyltransferase
VENKDMEYNVDKINQELKGWDGGEYYGQWETDKVIESYFDNGYKGTCIEVGAANGFKGSNTLYFEERGWNTLCIEPNTEHTESLEKYRKLVRYYACSDKKGTFPLTVYRVGEKNIMSSLTSLNPDDRLVEAHKDIINEKFIINVKVETLPWILENTVNDTTFNGVTNIDFISIDTEGTELDVLKGFDFDKYSVKLFVVENNYDDPEIGSFMESKGFIRDKRYKINDFYIKK